MSRCVGFPPPGFVWNGASGEALEELIRVRREAGAVEKRRKKEEKRRTKEERRRRMKEVEEEEMEEGEIRERECSGEKKHEKSSDDDDHENQLERSSLTEEHEHPMIFDHHDHDHHHSLYDSSDNTENIRPDFVSAAAQEKPALTPAEEESLYRDLIVNFDPPPIRTELHEFADQEWLFAARRRLPSSRHPPAVSNARNGGADDDSCLAASSLYPCLRYLPGADIHALPYTVLF